MRVSLPSYLLRGNVWRSGAALLCLTWGSGVSTSGRITNITTEKPLFLLPRWSGPMSVLNAPQSASGKKPVLSVPPGANPPRLCGTCSPPTSGERTRGLLALSLGPPKDLSRSRLRVLCARLSLRLHNGFPLPNGKNSCEPFRPLIRMSFLTVSCWPTGNLWRRVGRSINIGTGTAGALSRRSSMTRFLRSCGQHSNGKSIRGRGAGSWGNT